ncbi:MAG: SIS domain-containing protein [Rubricoccaceae bacterium]|nr:SIS domain-containing protein [Rubricoccaceae bacterium]
MQNILQSISSQLAHGIEKGEGVSLPPYRRIICAGMGGSSIAGEILSIANPEVIVHWDYGLPKSATGGDLVICTSWSGDTEETVSAWQAARDMGLDTLVITSGGALADMAREARSPLIELDRMNDSPRMNAIMMASALFAALGMTDSLPQELAEDDMRAQGKELAEAIGDRIPVIYAAYPHRKLTGFWKNVYSETAKRQVMVNWFPSAAHVEVVGWEGPYQDILIPVLLRDPVDEDDRYARNFDALLAILAKKGYNVPTIQLSGNTLMEKVFNNYLLALWTSFYAATALGVDPVALTLLNEFKALKAKAD